MAEHSRSSGVFSRRLAVVNGGCCRPPARPRRYPVQSSLRRDPHTGVCVCKSGALAKKLAPTAPRHPPAAYAAETTTSLSPCSLSARQKSLSVQVWSRDRGCISRIFFFAQPSALFVAAPTTTTTTTTAGPLSPPFLQPSKMAVRLIIFFCRHNSL